METTTNTNTMGDYEFAFNMLKSLATMLSKQVSTRAVMDAVVESVWNGDVADEYLIDHVVNNGSQRDLFANLHTADMIDHVFENCSEHELFDRVQSFIAGLDDSQFRNIITR